MFPGTAGSAGPDTAGIKNSKIDNSKVIRLKIILLFFGLLTLYNSCCPFIKEENLGNNFYLSEYDNVDRRILYAEESCSKSGIEIVPMTVIEYANNSKWIIAKSSASRQTAESKYWIIDKDFKVKIIQDNDSTINVIKSHVFGPFDSTTFIQLLLNKDIKLTLKKIEKD